MVLSTGSLRAVALLSGTSPTGALHVRNAFRTGDGFRARTVCVGDAVWATTVRVGTLRGTGFLPGEWNRDCDCKNERKNDTRRAPTRLRFAREPGSE